VVSLDFALPNQKRYSQVTLGLNNTSEVKEFKEKLEEVHERMRLEHWGLWSESSVTVRLWARW
jgi:hypothetical protein